MAAASVLAAVLGAGPAAAGADTGAVGAFGLNDLRSDGILLRNASYDGEADLDAARDAGVRLYRARLRLDCLGPDLDFAKPSATCHGLSYDDLVRELAARDMALLPILINFGAGPGGAYVPVPPTPDGAGGTPTRERFAAFAAAAARRYGPGGTFWATCGCVPRPVRAWEVWNEQNNGWWWGGSASAEDYAGVFRDVRAALRGVDPAARAVVGGVVWDRNGQSSFVEPDAFVAALAAGNANAFDAIAIHPYTDARGASPEQLAGAAAAFTDLMAASLRRHTGPGPDGAPRQQIWITEMGWSDTDAAPDTIAQGLAQFVARLDGGLRAADNVGPVLWYMLRDSGYKGGRDDQLGLRLTLPTGADGGPKPAWDVFAAAAQAH
ncbi:MAG: hypothetical protein HZB46_02845, partial [Solirubrobacterales bacterium]|nr:hypothetical protein [Solirubrobacterales bacterium]